MYRRLFLKYANTPLLATNTLVQNAVSLLLSSKSETPSQPQAISTKEGATYADLYEIRGNVGILNITGPIFRYGKVEACDTVYGTQHFSQVLANFEKNDEIEHIVIQFDTGGGEASGISELAEQIHNCNKPTTAYIDNLGASAGYWLASPCDRVVANETALIGSIGVVFAFLDTSKMEEDMGIETIEIVSDVSPNKRIDIKSDDGRAKIQVLANDLADIFVSNIATYRSVSTQYVKDNFGKGDVMIASKALDAKMIDEIGTFENLITEIKGELMEKPKPVGAGAGASTPTTEPTATALTAEAFKTANPTAYQDIFNAGATHERERIEGIYNIDAPYYQSVIQTHMFDGVSSVKDVKVALFDAKEDKMNSARTSFAKGGQKMADALGNISTVRTNIGFSASDGVDASIEKATKKINSKRGI